MTFLPPNNGVMSTKIRNRGPLRQEIDPARLQQPPAPAERALADRTEDRFVFLIVFCEVFGRVVDDSVGAPDPGLPAVREGIMRAFGTGRSLLVSQVRQDGRKRTAFGDRHVFSMSTERAAESDESEHSVADIEGRDVTADRLDSSRKIVPHDRPPLARRAR